MASIYSALLVSIAALPSGPSVLLSVPDGEVIVVRDMVASSNAGWGQQTLGFAVYDVNGVALWSVCPPFTVGAPSSGGFGRSLHWDGRQVLEAGDELTFLSSETAETPLWSLRISGYRFTS